MAGKRSLPLILLGIFSIFLIGDCKLNSRAAPKFTNIQSTTYEVPAGQKLKLKCLTRGHPRPYLTWYHNGEIIPVNRHRFKIFRYSLRIDNVVRSDTGMYACHADNPYGEAWRNFTINVIDKLEDGVVWEPPETDKDDFVDPNVPMAPRWSKKKIDSQLVRVQAGNTLILKCPAIGNPPPTLEWWKNGERFRRRRYNKPVFRAYLVKLHETTKNDNGNYTCIAENKYGQINFTFLVKVDERVRHKPSLMAGLPKNVTTPYGGNATLECRIAVTDAHANIQWLKHYKVNNSYINKTTGVGHYKVIQKPTDGIDPGKLQLKNVTYGDSGWYTCLVSNLFGVEHKSAWLEVVPEQVYAYNNSVINFPKQKGGENNQKITMYIVIGCSAGALANIIIIVSVYLIFKRRASRYASYPQPAVLVSGPYARVGLQPHFHSSLTFPNATSKEKV